MKIYINPGHSDKDPGAVGFARERDLNVKVAGFLEKWLLENYDCEVKVTPGSNNSPKAAAQDANDWGADLFVSIHFNAGGGDGYEVLIYNENRMELGKVFEKYVKQAGQNSRGVKFRPDLAVLRYTHMPAVLNEGAFVDNEKDIADWNEDGELEKLATAYGMAAAEFLQLEKKNVVTVILPVLSIGSKGEAVKALQSLLKGRGYALNVTGNFGKGTKARLQQAQTDRNLMATGEADRKTWTALLGIE